MWLWECELLRVGLRRRSDGYWKCERRYGLPANAYVSVFGRECLLPAARSRNRLRVVEVSAFHVTFLVGTDNIHFYYHEQGENAWEPGGHTSRGEILRHGENPAALRGRADEIAAGVIEALGGMLIRRGTHS